MQNALFLFFCCQFPAFAHFCIHFHVSLSNPLWDAAFMHENAGVHEKRPVYKAISLSDGTRNTV